MTGNDILVKKKVGNSYTLIGAARSNEVETGCDEIEVCSSTNGTWRAFMAGRKDWRLTLNYLVLASSQVSDLLEIGSTYQLQIVSRDGSGVYGDAILLTCRQTATRGNISQGSFVFRGTGALTAISSNI